MPSLTVKCVWAFEAPQGKRLVPALMEETGLGQHHACGGNARCTTCRSEFLSGEPVESVRK
jgi:ferredoxin